MVVFQGYKTTLETNVPSRQSIVNLTNDEDTPSLSIVPTKTVSSTKTPLLSTRAVKSPQQAETPSVSCTKRCTPNILERLIEKASNSECECLKFLCDNVNQISSKNQPLITDFFESKYTVLAPKNNGNEKYKRFLEFREPKIKNKLEVLLSLSKEHGSSSKDNKSILIDSSVDIRERFLQKIKFNSEICMSMSYLSCKSDSSLSQNDNNSKGKDNIVLNKVSSNNYHSSDEIRDRSMIFSLIFKATHSVLAIYTNFFLFQNMPLNFLIK